MARPVGAADRPDYYGGDYMITWHELTVAFIVNTGLQLPVWIQTASTSRARPFLAGSSSLGTTGP